MSFDMEITHPLQTRITPCLKSTAGIVHMFRRYISSYSYRH